MDTTRSTVLACLCALGAIAFSAASSAQSFPNKPIRIIVPYAPGGIVDIVARAVSSRLADKTRQAVVVDNRPGAAGAVAMDLVKQAPADGYTLVLADPALVINPVIQPKLSYRITRDLQPVSAFATTGLILAVHPSVPASDVAGLIRYSKQSSSGLNFSSPGIGTVPHMAGELFNVRGGISSVHVPYKGGSAAIADVLSGQIQMVFFTPSVILPFIQQGRVRGLAYTGSRRSLVAPELPTMAEAGVLDFEANVWLIFAAGAKTPQPVIEQLSRFLSEIARQEDIRALLAKSDIQLIGGSPEEATRMIEADEKRWHAIVKSNNIKPE
ncbi:tripartite tricarboxylate transporter substrate binding protein [Polaromonas sp. P1(28)-8]|nr:tripartite tricarboxylate transporter substrate binding protein [Polaromonas sp. P1(28)-8]